MTSFSKYILLIITLFVSIKIDAMSCKLATTHSKEAYIRVRSTLISGVFNKPIMLSQLPSDIGGLVSYIGEGGYVIVSKADRNVPDILFTDDILSCAVVIVYDPVAELTLFSHLNTMDEKYVSRMSMQIYVDSLISEMTKKSGNFGRSEVTIVWGTFARPLTKHRMEYLLDSLNTRHPHSISIDSIKDDKFSLAGHSVYFDLKAKHTYKEVQKADQLRSVDISKWHMLALKNSPNP